MENPKKRFHFLKEYTGYQRQLLTIRDAVSHPRESSVINITGAYGSGRSSILDYIQYQLEEHLWALEQIEQPIVIRVQGQNFTKEDSFLEFLALQISSQISNINTIQSPVEADQPVEKMFQQLQWLSDSDHPVFIMIDNFNRIIERLEPTEAQGLNRLKISGVHYLFVTDYRSIHDIAPKLARISDFFKNYQPIAFPPLNKKDSQTLLNLVLSDLDELYEREKCCFTEDALALIENLAGGHAKLLVSVLQHAYFDLCEPELSTVVQVDAEKLCQGTFLRFLPENDVISSYLNKMIESTKDYPLSLNELQFLVSIAMQSDSVPNLNGSILPNETKVRIRLSTMGFLRDPQNSDIGSKLIQFAILNNIIPLVFSDAEKAVVDLFQSKRPGLITFQELDGVLGDKYVKSEDPKTRRRYIDSTISRIRKKLASIPNAKAIPIDNERGEGFYIGSSIPFDLFYAKGPDVFRSIETGNGPFMG
jgi:hypothetical protein